MSYKAIYAYASDVAETTVPGPNRTADTVIFTLGIGVQVGNPPTWRGRPGAHLARLMQRFDEFAHGWAGFA